MTNPPPAGGDEFAAKRARLASLRAATRRARIAVGIVLLVEIVAVVVLTTGWPVAL